MGGLADSRRARTIVLGAAITVALASAPDRAGAATGGGCPIPAAASPTLAAVDPVTRLAWIDGQLSRDERRARAWTYGWGGGIAAAGIGSLLAVPFVAPENRVDWYTGAVSAGVGVAAFVIVPPAVLHDAPALRAEVARSTPATDVCASLLAAETDLIRDARDEARQGRWYLHLGNLLFNAGLGLFLGLGYHHWGAGAINAVAGAAVGEAIILTHPSGAVRDLDAYLAGLPEDTPR